MTSPKLTAAVTETPTLSRDERRQGLATIKEASGFLTVGHVTVYAMIRDGQLASTKIRNARRIPWSALYAITDAAMQGGE